MKLFPVMHALKYLTEVKVMTGGREMELSLTLRNLLLAYVMKCHLIFLMTMARLNLKVTEFREHLRLEHILVKAEMALILK